MCHDRLCRDWLRWQSRMSLYRCVYVSSAKLGPVNTDEQIARIVDHATVANAAMRVTGALMYDGTRFAQLLEGPIMSAERLAERIARDPRHSRLVFLEKQLVKRRLFDGFSLAYMGNSLFVERTIALPLFSDDRRSNFALRQLIQMMQEFAR